MKKIQLFSLLIGLFVFTACKNNKGPKTVAVETTATKTINAAFQKAQPMAMSIEGMVCAIGCAALIEKNLNQKATLIFDAEVLSSNQVTQIVLNTGEAYTVKDFQLLD